MDFDFSVITDNWRFLAGLAQDRVFQCFVNLHGPFADDHGARRHVAQALAALVKHHDQRAKHSATAETTKQHSVSNRATVDAMSDGRQQGQKTAREEHRGSRP